VSEDSLGECGACNALVPLDSTRCPECGVLFVADDVVDILRQWVADTGINIRKLFEKFDENDDGTIDSDELRKGLLSLNLADLPPSQVDRLVLEIDADGNGVIDLDEFDLILLGDDSNEPDEAETEASDESSDDEPTEAEEDGADEDADETVDVPVVVIQTSDDDEGSDEDSEGEDVDEEVHDIDDEDFDLEDEDPEDEAVMDEVDEDEDAEEEQESHRPLASLAALADLMDEHDISAQRLFNELDADGNGMISVEELKTMVEEKYGDVLEIEQVHTIMEGTDGDGDGMIDITEFIGSMEDYDAMETLVEEKVFPSPWQKRMMSKSWSETVWPILHVGFGIIIAIFIANGMFGFIDGSGGNIVYEPNDSGLIPSGNIAEGDVYPCDEKYQKDGCRNSLTPLAGENGSISMPTKFYWDGVLFIFLSLVGLSSTLFLHLVKAPEWRARAKAMKEFEADKSEANDATETSSEDAEDIDEEAHDEELEEGDDDDSDEEDHSDDDDDDGEESEGDDDDDIDIGSHIGLVFDDEEVYGKIVEFDDDEGTVTIEEDGTGDLVTGYQEDMFIE
jgi:Ca2+-binding EF-hand superfamily protein